MTEIPETFPGGSATGVYSDDRPVVDLWETIGEPDDPAATDVDDENSAFSLLKGILVALGTPAGSGTGVVNTSRKIQSTPEQMLGIETDAETVTAASRNTAISLLKGIAARLGL